MKSTPLFSLLPFDGFDQRSSVVNKHFAVNSIWQKDILLLTLSNC